MATITEEAEQTRYVIDILNLTSEGGDTLDGDVEEATVEAKRLLKKLKYLNEAKRLDTVRQGFKNWQDALGNLEADSHQLAAVKAHEESIRGTLIDMTATAESVTEILTEETPIDVSMIGRCLEALSDAIDELNSYFPDARPPRRYRSFQSPNLPDYVNNATFGTDTMGSGSTSASPPPRPRRDTGRRSSAGPNNSHSNPHPRAFTMPHASTDSNTQSMPRQRRYYGQITISESQTLHAGDWNQTPEDAVAAANSGGAHYAGFNLSGTGVAILGNVNGSRYPMHR